ncbi:LOW QUALITY PROTEIN: rhodopsin, GQ-coupled-like [Pecten maximus]|uniref:LOW QUALITY PROTEIN: rhodopsin, GQ-coupled-like n=1 Tax=Pecten maximus TaxID=6579 RepID=UPI00145811B8|nr:LOW QUALITY PROTEIN: rhodopsin, GQ-coupled-like [Pecten maximus]
MSTSAGLTAISGHFNGSLLPIIGWNGSNDIPVHPHWTQFPPVTQEWHYVIGIYITIVGLLGITGNSVVIYIFSNNKSLRSPSNLLVINLAVSDLIFSAFNGFPLLTISSFHQKWMFGSITCQLYGFVGGVFGLMSINTLAAISIDRYIVITKPLQASQTMTRSKVHLMIMFVWVFSILLSVPPFFGWGAYIPEGFQTSCTFDYLTKTPRTRAFIIVLYLFGFALPLIIISICYIMIIHGVRRHDQKMLTLANNLKAEDIRANNKRAQSELKISKIAMTVTCLFIISWSPYAVIALIAQFGPAHWITPLVSELPMMLAKSSSMHNPIIYALSHPKFRTALYKRAPWMFCCCKPAERPDFRTSFNYNKREVTRTESANSDVSSVFSNFSDSTTTTAMMDRKPTEDAMRVDRETSFSRSVSIIRTDDESCSYPAMLLLAYKVDVDTIFDMKNDQTRRNSNLHSLYIPTRVQQGPTTPSLNAPPGEIYVVDNVH